MASIDTRTRRLFIAAMLPSEGQRALAGLLGGLDPTDTHATILRPIRAEGSHLTLRFLGETTDEEMGRVATACATAAAADGAFGVAFGPLGVFPNARRPRVVWVGLHKGVAPLLALHRRLEDALLSMKVVAGRERYTPHVTLARVHDEAAPSARAALGALIANRPPRDHYRCAIDRLSLVQSILVPGGARYTVLQQWPLSDPRATPNARH